MYRSAASGEAAVAANDTSASEKARRELRSTVHNALRSAAVETGPAKTKAIARLAEVYIELSRDTQLPEEDRLTLGRTVRSRLKKIADQLTAQNAKAAKVAGQSIVAAKSATHSSSQTAGGDQHPKNELASKSSGAAGGGTADDGQALVELIQKTIAPSTWDINGGVGTIQFFAPRNALVVRQTDEGHDSLTDLLKQLHDFRD